METPALPPEKRTGLASPMMIYIIVGIITATFALFLILRP
jgi:hypothetical protein